MDKTYVLDTVASLHRKMHFDTEGAFSSHRRFLHQRLWDSIPPFDAWFHPMRPLYARLSKVQSVHIRPIPATNVLPVLWVLMTIWLLRTTNVQGFGKVAMSSMPGVLHAFVVFSTSNPASIEARMDCGVIWELKPRVEGCVPVLALWIFTLQGGEQGAV